MAKLKYDESFPGKAGEYAAAGMNNNEIAAKLEIGENAFYAYQRQFPAFAEALALGRQAVDDDMETSLSDLAMGNCFTTTVANYANGREIKTVRQRAPDLKAILRWLKKNKQYADEGPAESQSSKSISRGIMANLKYDESFPEKAEQHAGNGDTDSKIAARLGISPASFYNYKRQFPEFAEAMENGRRLCYGRLRSQLLAIALGNCTVKTETYRDGRLYKTAVRQRPPNLKAIIYWLAQQDSKISEMDASPADSACSRGETGLAQQDSKISETDSCPADSAVSRGETGLAQQDSKISEMPVAAAVLKMLPDKFISCAF
jgi:DNA-binding CsgD family transcriptional regulator